jgi:predicted N-formylglutamate amidohydrolase
MPDSSALAVIVTCEHGGNHVPPEYAPLFEAYAALLNTHRGCDAGALYMARHLSRILQAPLYASETTRLLVDLNRSPDQPTLFSEITRKLSATMREKILAHYYRPYREEVEKAVAAAIAQGHRVLHISSHSFTPVLDGKTRETEIGLLYDPARKSESALCDGWLEELQRVLPDMRVRRNYPYRGTSDGFTAYLRTRHMEDTYAGIELEINQKLVGDAFWTPFCRDVACALMQVAGKPDAFFSA